MGGPKTMGGIIKKYYDNSFENIGNQTSFTWYGPRWACAATAPSRGFKTMITEGGIRCPCIVRYPPFAADLGAITKSFTTVMDVLPTVLDLARVTHPGTTFRGRDVVVPRGKSWVGHLGSKKSLALSSVYGEHTHVHGWELFGQRAIREGKWKAVWINKPRVKDDWELYNVEVDPSELDDLCEKEPGVLNRLIDHWEVYYAETGMIQTPVFAVTKA